MGPELIIWTVNLAAWGIGWLLLFKVPPCRAAVAGRFAPLSVIIPARNEEHNLPRLLDSLRHQPDPPEEIIVVDDGSTDRTAELARAAGARLIPSLPLPQGWRGKAWACHQGAQAAAHDTLLFMDADTWLEPGGLVAVLDTFAQTGGALSLAAFHCVRHPYEQLSAFFNWVMAAATGAFAPRRRAHALFGPFLMVSKADYHRAGGHAAVKNRVLENVFLAAEFRRAGVSLRCFGGRGVLAIRMYPGGARELCAGWGKAFASGAVRTPPLLLAGIVFWLGGAALSAVMPVAGSAPISWGICYVLFAAQFWIQLRRLGSFAWWTALFYPVPLVFFFVLFAYSALRRQRSWKGRSFREEAPC